MKYMIAHDIGTSGNKATLFSIDGAMIASRVHNYPVIWGNNNMAEQKPDDWFNAVCTTTKALMQMIDLNEVIGISFSGQMMGCLCVDEDGKALRNAIIWADTRASEEEQLLQKIMPPMEFYNITGHRPSASYGLAKLMWIKNHEPEIYKRTYKVLNAKDYIIARLTGSFVTDYSDASGMNLLDINSLEWSWTIANAVDIDLDKMPKLEASTNVVGYVTEEGSKMSGLVAGTPVVCGGGDGAMSAVGAMCIEDDDAFCTIGTSAWNAKTSNQPVFDDEMRMFNWVHIVPGKYIPCGTMQAAGASVTWMKEQLASYEVDRDGEGFYEQLNETISQVAVGAGGLIYLPYLLGERSPRWDKDVRGTFLGLQMNSTRAEILRAVYEGVAYNLEIILKLIDPNHQISSLVMTGGGAKSPVWCQIFADIYNVAIKIPNHIEEATAIGAAVTVGVGLGLYDDFEAVKKFIKIEDTIKPQGEHVTYYEQMKPIFEAAYQALKSVYKEKSHALQTSR